ncbi:lytic transglycosylase domain-containing protein [Nocardia cyriacigeorgica]|uniref:Lytic transglycosylase n=1 Tax=Nocardia cyriacigeorgica TaxID=135487 RepID=A0A6P1CZR1_9NOCA|nr:lytic murein transglycosylase [Nocardia cyriacigeorgica]NEW43517.1 lytic transglycosylase [Nocardia cyriacigeorgica]
MRIPAPITVSALVVAGLVATGSATHTTTSSTPPEAPEALLAASSRNTDSEGDDKDAKLSQTIGLLPVAPEPPRKLRAMTPPADGVPPFGGTVPLQSISLPIGGGTLGIPEVVLAAYRNAELALESSMPGCGVSWNLLAGIGRIESGHAGNGRTDAAGTSVTPIFGPALDGTLPGNEIIRATDGGYVRAIGPMQFLPGTWSLYSADGNGDGVSDPHNVFDATLAAGKYLCSGGLNLRDPAQELRAVLRYNNSMSYAANVLSWSAAYRTGGTPAPVTISPDLIPPGSAPIEMGPDMTAVDTTTATTTTETPPPGTPPPTTTPGEPMIIIPGLPPIPCGIFCPPPPPPAPGQVVPAPMPKPGAPADPAQPAAPADPAQPGQPGQPGQPAPQAEQAPGAPAQPAPADPNAQPPAEPSKTPEPGPPPAPAPTATPTPQPAVTLPFGIVVPLPAPPQ